MPNTPPLKMLLLAATGTGSTLLLGACSSHVKVQRIEYSAPTKTASAEPDRFSEQHNQVALAQSAQDLDLEPPPLSTLLQVRAALESIYDIDAELVASSIQKDPNRVHSLTLIAQLDQDHAQTLQTIIDRFGWPTRQMVGLKAVQGAYIAVQHANHDPEFQSQCLALISEQVDRGELPGAFLALMTDRVSLSRGDPQVYGTQMTMAPDQFGVMRAVPAASIWQPDQLDQRRASLGMPAHQRFIEAIEIAYFDSIGQSQTQLSSVPTE